ncbi:Dyp-type peroxidase [Archangium violaceum]|uniref:Dyp-type peroxidase n=1 Tax=Archangium violaceum TaxID=83451 RepID=UPI00193BB78D|nr:Dyp-type peroxidase domain-containing protein [Archangium violaceum]QRK10781.1 Dyp-type peroxidase [Archangium violaceum]
MMPQEGIFHSPGAFSGLAVLRLTRNAALPQLREVVSSIHEELSATQGLRMVLGLEPALLPESPTQPALLPREGPTARFPSSQAHVLVQMSTCERELLLCALRRVLALSKGVLYLEEELLGGRIGVGREPFGFRDGLLKPTREQVRRTAIVPSGPLAGASWLLYLRFQQDLDLFNHLRTQAQERVVGRTREGELVVDAPAEAHILRARASGAGENQLLIRRGFPFRHGGEEGLAFLAASADPDGYRRALDALLGADGQTPDAMLRYATAVGGGLYLAPPRGWFHCPAQQERRPAHEGIGPGL